MFILSDKDNLARWSNVGYVQNMSRLLIKHFGFRYRTGRRWALQIGLQRYHRLREEKHIISNVLFLLREHVFNRLILPPPSHPTSQGLSPGAVAFASKLVFTMLWMLWHSCPMIHMLTLCRSRVLAPNAMFEIICIINWFLTRYVTWNHQGGWG